ncbi:hypothetical protein GCM10020331_028570 [Ectobacillus funiculus]
MNNEWLELIKLEKKLIDATQETIYMTAISVTVTFILGLALGLLLFF